MRVAYLTAGAAGMYCGSCMHDNALARALIDRGVDCMLVPSYTPIRTDTTDISGEEVFFGGINIYLEQKLPFWGRLPHRLTGLLDRPALLRWATRGTRGASKQLLGNLTVSMLRGEHGRQRSEVKRLSRWLSDHASPNVIVLSNFLIGGCIPSLRRDQQVPIIVTLQGDDIFLDFLPPKQRETAIDLMRGLVGHVDAFIVNSQFYADKMAAILEIPTDKIHVVPLGIDTKPIFDHEQESYDRPPRVGYLARIDPAKGLHNLVDAFIQLQHPEAELHVAGWLGDDHREYAEHQWRRLDEAGFAGRYTYHGSPELAEKVQFLHSVDVFCVPTDYEEPKGLFALEAMAAGRAVVLPSHGVFPEMIGDSEAATLVRPEDSRALADAIGLLLDQPDERASMGDRARQLVDSGRQIEQMAESVERLLKRVHKFSNTMSRA